MASRVLSKAAAAAGLLVLAGGCTKVDGGAVEASWTIRTPDGRGSDCACSEPHIAKIRFAVVARGTGVDVCADKATCAFSCTRDGRTGATGFDLPPGDYDVSLVPLGDDGADLRGRTIDAQGNARGIEVPANPQRRSIVDGQVTQLDNFLVEAGCAGACGGADTTKVCSR